MKFIRINWNLQAFILSVLVFQSHCTCMMQWNTRLYYVCTKCKTRLVFFSRAHSTIYILALYFLEKKVKFDSRFINHLYSSFLVLIRFRRFSICICKDFCTFHDVTFSCGENSAWLKSMFVPSDIKWNSDTTLSRCTTWCIVPC